MKNSDKTTRVAYIIEAGFEYFISLFVTSTFLGYILDAVGFSDAMQGIISTVATFTCGAQLFALFVSDRNAKRMTVIGHSINQLCFVLLYLLPIFDIPPAAKSALLIVFLFAGHIINNAINPTKITWLMSFVPDSKRGSFTAVKEMVSLAGGMIVSVSLGAVADSFRDAAGNPTKPYYIICCVAVTLLMLIHTVTLLVSAERPMPKRPKASVGKVIKRIFTSADLLKVIGVGVLWNLASGLSVSFFASYAREELAFSFTVITIISTVGSFARIFASPVIGRLADKRSFSFSMTVCFAIIAVGFLSVCFTTPETRWIYIVYTCLHGIAHAGINSGVINLIYDYVVPEDRAVALGIKNSIGGIVGFLAALVSGAILAGIQAKGGFRIFGLNLYAQQVLSFMSFVAVVLLIVYMRFVVMPMRRVEVDYQEEKFAAEALNKKVDE